MTFFKPTKTIHKFIVCEEGGMQIAKQQVGGFRGGMQIAKQQVGGFRVMALRLGDCPDMTGSKNCSAGWSIVQWQYAK